MLELRGEPFPPGPRGRARLAALALSLVVVLPLLTPGYVLLRDMVFVPRPHLGPSTFGIADALPRAVPADAVVAAVSLLVPAQVLQKVLLVALVTTAALGAARLAPRSRADGAPGTASIVAGLAYSWNPFVAERLLMGHWSLVLAYAALPWVAIAGLALRAGRPGASATLVLAVAPAALLPSGLVLALGVALAVAAAPGRPRRWRTVVTVVTVGALLAAPWTVAGLTRPGGASSDPAGVAAFAARSEGADGPVGLILTLTGGGGVWNAEAVPGSRASPAAPVVALALLGLAVLGVIATVRARRARAGPPSSRLEAGAGSGLVLLAAVGLLLATAGALPVTDALVRAATTSVPGAGLLRDGQKWIAWWLLPLALGVGAGAARSRRLLTGRDHGRLMGAAVAALVVLAVPDLAWGLGGRLAPVAFPADWERVRTALATDPAPGSVLLLPPGAVRAFAWNAGRPQLDPAPRYLPRETVADDDLVVSGVRVAGEDRTGRRTLALADDPAALAARGVGWVLVEHGTPGSPPPAWVVAAPRVVSGPWLDLVRVPDVRPPPPPAPARVVAVGAAHALALGTVALAAGVDVARRRRAAVRRRSGRGSRVGRADRPVPPHGHAGGVVVRQGDEPVG